MTTKPHRVSLRRRINWGVTCLALALAPPVQAAFHFAHIDEIMASYNGNDGVQFIEIEMQLGQNLITNAVIAVFDADGNFVKDAIVFPSNVPNASSGDRFIVGTPSFATVSELTPDFTMAADLPTDGGMVCFGGGGGIFPDPDPNNWSRTALESYVDCLAYGSYSGPTKLGSGNPTPLLPVGHSLARVSNTDDTETDFDCGDPATPTNNAGTSGSLDATIVFCPEPEIAFAQLAALACLTWLNRRRAIGAGTSSG